MTTLFCSFVNFQLSRGFSVHINSSFCWKKDPVTIMFWDPVPPARGNIAMSKNMSALFGAKE